MVINISRDFTDSPGARFRTDGEFSGQEFLEDILLGRFEEAVRAGKKLLIDLDNSEGYATSFLDGSFGELARLKGRDLVLEHLVFKAELEPSLIDEIIGYINESPLA